MSNQFQTSYDGLSERNKKFIDRAVELFLKDPNTYLHLPSSTEQTNKTKENTIPEGFIEFADKCAINGEPEKAIEVLESASMDVLEMISDDPSTRGPVRGRDYLKLTAEENAAVERGLNGGKDPTFEQPVAFKKKNDLHTKWDFFLEPFRAIANAHEFGNLKYAKYSWCNDPENSFSTVESSIGSILNHLILHRTGQLYDNESGFLHSVHLCCRSQMTLAPFYKTVAKDAYYKKLTDSREIINNVLNSFHLPEMDGNLWTDQLSPEIVLSAMKFDPSKFISTVEEAEALMWHCALQLNRYGVVDKREDIWNTVYEIDLIFWCACMIHNETIKYNKPRLFIPKEVKSGWK